MKSIYHPLNATGIGLRLTHFAEMLATRPSSPSALRAAWLEVHPENVMANPHAAEILMELSRHYPISLHTVGISIGSASGIDRVHLKRLRALVDRIDPILVSGHLAWSAYSNEYLNDLLPLPYTEETLRLVAANVREVQETLGRPYSIENPANYVGFVTSKMTETEFLSELVHQSGCSLLCDVSNVVVSAHNMGYDSYRYIDDFPAGAVGEIHLGGYTPEEDAATPGRELWIDTHGAAIAERSWSLYAYAIQRFGPKPTLIEWDNNLPTLDTLLGEAAHADEIRARETYDAAAR